MSAEPIHPLRRLILQATPAQRRELALALLAEMRKPGRQGVYAASVIATQIGCEDCPGLLAAAWKAELPQPSWSMLLAMTWIFSSVSVVDGAKGDRALMREWFEKAGAHEPLPFMSRWLQPLSELPDRFRVWRGGTRPLDELKAGFSWSRDRSQAAFFARHRYDEHLGKPLILTAEVTRDQVAMATHLPAPEVVLLTPPASEMDVSNHDEIKEISEPFKAIIDEMRQTAERLVLSRDGDEGWQGWTG